MTDAQLAAYFAARSRVRDELKRLHNRLTGDGLDSLKADLTTVSAITKADLVKSEASIGASIVTEKAADSIVAQAALFAAVKTALEAFNNGVL